VEPENKGPGDHARSQGAKSQNGADGVRGGHHGEHEPRQSEHRQNIDQRQNTSGGRSGAQLGPARNSIPVEGDGSPAPIYGALDLGTNNCRLLLARPSRRGFRVVDAFSRIIRLGEGLGQTGRLSEPAMTRTIDALRICAGKLDRHGVDRARLVATEACRVALNGQDFIGRVRDRVGLKLEILGPEAEAKLAVSGCASLIESRAEYVLVFDIGGGSSEIIWLDLTTPEAWRRGPGGRVDVDKAICAWTSLPVGVVTMAERFDGRNVSRDSFESMVASVQQMLHPFEARHGFRQKLAGRSLSLLGTSGTVTTIAGILLGLPRYDRNKVDGSWLKVPDVSDVTQSLLAKSYEQRIAEPCIGRERADLVLAGCAILEAVLRLWPAERLRVADRGLREGILTTLMIEDGVWRSSRRHRRIRGRDNGA
jgi:exopolyphosphatase/guanosine-5'-triphosphate,3'-diphosphate pyrophosphatase